jgi:hypothetical protein
LISTKCTCGTDIRIEFDSMIGDGQRFVPLQGTIPPSVKHCSKGTFIVVPGKITAFYEIVDGKLIAAEPIMSDALED